MSDSQLKMRREINAPGPLYVDKSCLSCEACWKTAPHIFKSHPLETYAYVAQQPENPEEHELCQEIKKLCPAGSIHFESN
jgi:ferredoxin